MHPGQQDCTRWAPGSLPWWLKAPQNLHQNTLPKPIGASTASACTFPDRRAGNCFSTSCCPTPPPAVTNKAGGCISGLSQAVFVLWAEVWAPHKTTDREVSQGKLRCQLLMGKTGGDVQVIPEICAMTFSNKHKPKCREADLLHTRNSYPAKNYNHS